MRYIKWVKTNTARRTPTSYQKSRIKKVEEENNMTIEDDIDEQDVIVDKPRSNEDYEEIPSATGEDVIEKFHH